MSPTPVLPYHPAIAFAPLLILVAAVVLVIVALRQVVRDARTSSIPPDPASLVGWTALILLVPVLGAVLAFALRPFARAAGI